MFPVRPVGCCGLLALLLVAVVGSVPAPAQEKSALRIGWSGTLVAGELGKKERVGLDALQGLIQEETGLDNEILYFKDWRELGKRMAEGKLALGMFPGYEFAWAQDKNPKLRPLAVALNTDRYPVACVMVRKDSKVADFAGLGGKKLALSPTEQSYVRLFVQRQSQAAGKEPAAFFSRTTKPESIEDALDDVVDGVVDATVVDRAALERYSKRKPGRFNQLKVLERSRSFPPMILANVDGNLDVRTLDRFREGLVGANRKRKGQTLLTLFRVTGFEGVPRDLDRVLTETHKDYPPQPAK